MLSLNEKPLTDIWARMEKGDKYLTAIYGNWKARINLETLDMSSASKCILAQLEGNFWSFVNVRNGRNTEFFYSLEKMFFCADVTHQICSEYEMTKYWKQYIRESLTN